MGQTPLRCQARELTLTLCVWVCVCVCVWCSRCKSDSPRGATFPSVPPTLQAPCELCCSNPLDLSGPLASLFWLKGMFPGEASSRATTSMTALECTLCAPSPGEAPVVPSDPSGEPNRTLLGQQVNVAAELPHADVSLEPQASSPCPCMWRSGGGPARRSNRNPPPPNPVKHWFRGQDESIYTCQGSNFFKQENTSKSKYDIHLG